MAAALMIVALILGALLLLWHKQERILFQPPPFSEEAPLGGRVSYDAVDGQKLVGFIIGDPEQSTGVLICFHGNADLALWQIPWARAVHHHTGYAVFLAEYRGYMSLSGAPVSGRLPRLPSSARIAGSGSGLKPSSTITRRAT